ncbi:MAG: tetratricopeptide repeat protein [Bacteroidota bacterium]
MLERSPELFETIERYLGGEMPAVERSDFETRIAADQELRQEVDKHRLIHEVADDTQTIEFAERLERFAAEVKLEKPRQESSGRLLYQIAAGVLLLLAAFATFWQMNSSSDSEALFTDYYQPFPFEGTRAADTESEVAAALKLYNNGDFAKAKKALVPLVAKFPRRADLQLYMAICQIQDQQYSEAIATLSKISDDPIYREDAMWYMGLSHLRSGNTSAAIDYLNKVIDYDGARKSYAQSLRKILLD